MAVSTLSSRRLKDSDSDVSDLPLNISDQARDITNHNRLSGGLLQSAHFE